MSEYPKPGPVTGLLESTKAPNRNILVVGAVSVGLILLGAFLPWVKAQAGFISISRNGFEDGGDGLFTLLIGIGVGIVYGRLITAASQHRRSISSSWFQAWLLPGFPSTTWTT